MKKIPKGPGTNSGVLHSGRFSSQLSLQSLKSGFHMIAAIVVIAAIVAIIWKPPSVFDFTVNMQTSARLK